jgi:hypothetical protein
MSFHRPDAQVIAMGEGDSGDFVIDSPEPGWSLALICSDGTDPEWVREPWEHVSVRAYKGRPGLTDAFGLPVPGRQSRTLQSRVPTWKEMQFVKSLCWDPEDVVMQLHPRQSEYINAHPCVLHLWRPKHREIPTPPKDFV